VSFIPLSFRFFAVLIAVLLHPKLAAVEGPGDLAARLAKFGALNIGRSDVDCKIGPQDHPITFTCRLDRNFAIDHILTHVRRITFERVTIAGPS
jgi:hypothetical protein